jgi:site-specific DNA-cytosine methylase
MLENVPGLSEYYLFKNVVRRLRKIGYFIKFDIEPVAQRLKPLGLNMT